MPPNFFKIRDGHIKLIKMGKSIRVPTDLEWKSRVDILLSFFQEKS